MPRVTRRSANRFSVKTTLPEVCQILLRRRHSAISRRSDLLAVVEGHTSRKAVMAVHHNGSAAGELKQLQAGSSSDPQWRKLVQRRRPTGDSLKSLRQSDEQKEARSRNTRPADSLGGIETIGSGQCPLLSRRLVWWDGVGTITIDVRQPDETQSVNITVYLLSIGLMTGIIPLQPPRLLMDVERHRKVANVAPWETNDLRPSRLGFSRPVGEAG